MKPKYDPYQIFRDSRTPQGLYARKKWFNESHTPQWKADFDQCVSRILDGQHANGSWDNSVLTTAHRLFALHLTVRDPNDDIERALDWLISQIVGADVVSALNNTAIDYTSDDLQGLPFSPSNRDILLIGSTLFLACIFGRQDDKNVLSIYEHLNNENLKRQGNWGSWSTFNNLFRSFVVHPTYSKLEGIRMAVDALFQIQNHYGYWNDLPIYQTINALAHLDFKIAGRQLEKAFEYLVKIQTPDGTWGGDQPEWNTFLVVHALRNKDII